MFAFMSDLHLEMFPGFRVPKSDDACETLILAGDIGDPASDEYLSFLEDCSMKFKDVFVILGNHEHYGKNSCSETLECAKKAAAAAGVTLLHRSGYDLGENLRIVGATLWSHVEDHAARDVQCFISDYRRIGGVHSVAQTNQMHAEDVAFLEGEIDRAEARGIRLIVVTHHAPLTVGTSHPRFSRLNSAFATDLRHLVDRPGVAAWIFGHTHHSCDLGKVVSNQRGYVGEDTGFDPAKTDRSWDN